MFETIIEIRELILLTVGSEDGENYIAQTSIGFGEGMVNIFNLVPLPLEK